MEMEMEMIRLTGQYNTEENKIGFNFEEGQSLEINTQNDIDFTDLVKQLTFLIDNEKEIVITLDEHEEPKIKLIYETITEIIETYNLTVKEFKATRDLSAQED